MEKKIRTKSENFKITIDVDNYDKGVQSGNNSIYYFSGNQNIIESKEEIKNKSQLLLNHSIYKNNFSQPKKSKSKSKKELVLKKDILIKKLIEKKYYNDQSKNMNESSVGNKMISKNSLCPTNVYFEIIEKSKFDPNKHYILQSQYSKYLNSTKKQNGTNLPVHEKSVSFHLPRLIDYSDKSLKNKIDLLDDFNMLSRLNINNNDQKYKRLISTNRSNKTNFLATIRNSSMSSIETSCVMKESKPKSEPKEKVKNVSLCDLKHITNQSIQDTLLGNNKINLKFSLINGETIDNSSKTAQNFFKVKSKKTEIFNFDEYCDTKKSTKSNINSNNFDEHKSVNVKRIIFSRIKK